MASHTFELVGGNPVLDFLNTIHDWTTAESDDYLAELDDALRFGEAAGLLTRADARSPAARESRTELRRLRDLRARLERIFRAVIESRDPSAADLDLLATDAAAAARSACLSSDRGRVVRRIPTDRALSATLRWRLVEAAVALLTAPPDVLRRVKACPSCGWFFRDETKSNTRRWCSMATCGSIAKSRRYYKRRRRAPGR